MQPQESARKIPEPNRTPKSFVSKLTFEIARSLGRIDFWRGTSVDRPVEPARLHRHDPKTLFTASPPRSPPMSDPFQGFSKDSAVVSFQLGFHRSLRREEATKPAHIVSLIRGLYGRVSRKVGCDMSYVSRIARGQRRSPAEDRTHLGLMKQAPGRRVAATNRGQVIAFPRLGGHLPFTRAGFIGFRRTGSSSQSFPA